MTDYGFCLTLSLEFPPRFKYSRKHAPVLHEKHIAIQVFGPQSP